jgi:hypothetical protein
LRSRLLVLTCFVWLSTIGPLPCAGEIVVEVGTIESGDVAE